MNLLNKIFNKYFLRKSPNINKIELKLNYHFSNNIYLEKAITHRSIQNNSIGNYERLEFVGDAVIDQTISIWLFKKYPSYDEGLLTKKRSALVNRNFLAIVGEHLNLIDFVKVDPSVNITDSKVSNKIIADVYEALVGAIYLDGGYKSASKFVKSTLCKSEHLSINDENYKGQLIEYCHRNGFPTPQFTIIKSKGPEHEKIFFVSVIINANQKWEGTGSTKKSAEQNCALNAINGLSDR